MVASLSVPWGDHGNERGGYHLVWPRDLVECAGALLALGAEGEARDTLRYLIATQNERRHWHQNQWLGGTPFWQGVQLDETAFPVLLAAALAEREALRGHRVEDMVRRALGYHRSHRPGERAGPLGGERGHQRLHPCGLHRGTGRRRANCCSPPARDWALASRRFLECPHRGLDHGRAYDRWRGASAYPAITSASRRNAVLADPAASAAVMPIRNRKRRSCTARGRADRHRFPAARSLRAAPRRRPAHPRLAEHR